MQCTIYHENGHKNFVHRHCGENRQVQKSYVPLCGHRTILCIRQRHGFRECFFFVGLSWSKLLTAINCYCWHHCVSKCVNFTLPILWLMYYEDITHLCVTGLGRTLRQQRLHFHLDMQCLCIRPQETLVYSWTAEVNVAQLASVTKLCFANACCRLALKCYVTNLMFFWYWEL